MCGYYFEGYFLTGWHEEKYDSRIIDAEGLILGEEGLVAMGLTEYTGGDAKQARELINRFPHFALTTWVVLKIHHHTPLSSEVISWIDSAFRRQAQFRDQTESYWHPYNDVSPAH